MSEHVQRRRVNLATGLAYNVVEWAAEGPSEVTFVLVHGFTDMGAGWLAVAPHLTPHGRVLAPDMRGHGDSDRVGAGGYYHFFDYVADLDDVIRQLVPADQKVVLVGHSMGGSICSYYAGVRPQRLHALVLVEGLGPPDMMGGDGPTRTARWIDGWAEARKRTFKSITLDEAVRRLRKNDELLDEPLARQLAELGTTATADGVTWKHDPLHTTLGPYPYRLEAAKRHWEQITCPTLMIDGSVSRLNLAEAERAARRACFANHRHLVIDGAGHAVQRHRPRELAAAIVSMV